MKTTHLRRCRRVPLPAAYAAYASVGDASAPSIWAVLIALSFSTFFEQFAGLSIRMAHSRFARGRGASLFFERFARLSEWFAHSRFARGRGPSFIYMAVGLGEWFVTYQSWCLLDARFARPWWRPLLAPQPSS
jgi:hypothetical protein